MKIPFSDFSRETGEIGKEIRAALERVMDSSTFILGEEVKLFEQEFARFCSCAYGIGLASGTDALFLALKAMGIGPGDEVITVSHTFAATALAIVYTGATPVFIDIEESSYLMDPSLIDGAVTEKTKAVIPVHIYGMCADMDRITNEAAKHGLFVLEDACQAHGALYKGRPAGSLGHAAAFSFYPTKNLGAYGDGGMVTTSDAALNEKILLLRNYGQKDRYHHMTVGYNSRLDELQAAFLREKLRFLPAWIERRRKAAQAYDAGIDGINLVENLLAPGSTHVYHLYIVSTQDRDRLREYLSGKGIQTLIHYPVPNHLQHAFRSARTHGSLVHTEKRSGQILSLPMHPWIREDEVSHITESVREYFR